MGNKILNFIKYNNAFTIIFVVCFFGFGITYAASPTVRDNVYASEETVVSVDNSLVVSADLDNFNFNLRISSVTEDEKNYYAVYSYQTLVIENGFWQNKEMEKTLTVSKKALGERDLGLYVAKELGENINYELSYLKRVQKLEKEKGESQKIVTTEYSGLIGKLLDPKEQVIEGYNPVIPEPVPEVAVTVESNPQKIIVSTPYSQPTSTDTETSVNTVSETVTNTTSNSSSGGSGSAASLASSTSSTTAPTSETSTSTQTSASTTIPTQTPVPTPASTSTPASPPTPEDMVDEELIQEVVEELLQDQTAPESTAPEPEVAPPPPLDPSAGEAGAAASETEPTQ